MKIKSRLLRTEFSFPSAFWDSYVTSVYCLFLYMQSYTPKTTNSHKLVSRGKQCRFLTVLGSSVSQVATMPISRICSANPNLGPTSTTTGITTTTSTCSVVLIQFSTAKKQSKTMSYVKVTSSKTIICLKLEGTPNVKCALILVFPIVSTAMTLLFLVKIVLSVSTLPLHSEIKFCALCQMTIVSRQL